MKVYLARKRSKDIFAEGVYDETNHSLTVLKGSKVSPVVRYSRTFPNAYEIETQRQNYVDNCIVKEDVVFKSPTSAANFVTGVSTNGLLAWKDGNGSSLKELIKKLQ